MTKTRDKTARTNGKHIHPDATDELKESLINTAHAVGHTAELLTSDAKRSARRTSESVKAKAAELADRARGTEPPPPKTHPVLKAAAATALAVAVAGVVLGVLWRQNPDDQIP